MIHERDTQAMSMLYHSADQIYYKLSNITQSLHKMKFSHNLHLLIKRSSDIKYRKTIPVLLLIINLTSQLIILQLKYEYTFLRKYKYSLSLLQTFFLRL